MDLFDLYVRCVHLLFQTLFDPGAGHIFAPRHLYERLVSQAVAYDIPVLPAGFDDDHFQGRLQKDAKTHRGRSKSPGKRHCRHFACRSRFFRFLFDLF